MVILILMVAREVREIILILIVVGMAPIGKHSKVTGIRSVVQMRVLITLERRFVDGLG